MQVLFLQNVKNVAKKGEIKNVKDGYYLNFLHPQKLAVLATDGKVKEAKKLRESEMASKERVKENANEIKALLDQAKLTIKVKANGDKIYGSVTEKEVVDAVFAEYKIQLDKSNVRLASHIKVAGSYEVPLHLADGIDATLMLLIKGEK